MHQQSSCTGQPNLFNRQFYQFDRPRGNIIDRHSLRSKPFEFLHTSGTSDAYIGLSLNVIQNTEALTSMAAEVTVTYRFSIDVDFLDIISTTPGAPYLGDPTTLDSSQLQIENFVK